MQENPTSSIRQIARKLDFSNAATRKIVQKELKVKLLKFHGCQELSEYHKQKRLIFLFWDAMDRLIHL